MTSPEASTQRDIVVDASVAAKWLLRDERDLIAADRLLKEHDAARIGLVAPEQITMEVANSIRKAVLNRRLTPIPVS